MNKTQDLYKEAAKLIPGSTNLYSKRAELYAPEQWPAYYSRAYGCTIEDLDGRTYRDFTTMGLGACILGYSNPRVDRAASKAITRGSASTLNPPEEVELAKRLLQIHPWAGGVRFTRSGGEAIAVAIRIAQTYTSRDNIDWDPYGYHGWHINDPLTTDPQFPWCIEELGDSPLAAILTEPRRMKEADLPRLRKRADRKGALLICDEITSGFRFNLGGAHLAMGVTPDIAVFAKAMSNGYPMAAVIGIEKVMSAAQDTFISSTSWSERIGPTAALETIQEFEDKKVAEHLVLIGDMVQSIWIAESRRSGLTVTVSGPPQLSHLDFGSASVQTLYTQLMLERGFLASKDFYPSYGHQIEDVEDYLVAVRDVFPLLQKAIEKGTVLEQLKGPIAYGGLKRI